jgi:hypothetical protein
MTKNEPVSLFLSLLELNESGKHDSVNRVLRKSLGYMGVKGYEEKDEKDKSKPQKED